MVAINPEMLRELLDEFTEKEEVTREEMNAINQQIAELEKRIESSKEKLAGLNKDREKIDLMRERYLSGNWNLQLSNMAVSAAAANSAPVASSVSAPAPAPMASPAPTPTPTPSSHAEGRAARRAAREASSQPAASEATDSSSPEPVTQEPEPVAVAVTEVAPESIPELEPIAEVLPEPEPQQEVIVEPAPLAQEAPASDAPTFSSVAQFEATQAEAAQAEAAQAEAPIEHAPPDDPIMSSFSSAPSSAPDINSALAYGSPSQEAAAIESEDSGFSWSSTALNAVPGAGPDNSTSSPSPVVSLSASMPSPAPNPNPWGSGDSSPAQAEVEQRQSAADIWGHPAAPQPASPAAQQPAGSWGDFGEDWQMKEAEAQRAAAANAPVPVSQPPAPTASSTGPGIEGGWGQTGGGSPWSNPATAQPAPADLPPAGGGWGQPTASRQGMPAMQAPTNFPLAAPPQAAPSATAPSASESANSAGDAWGRSGQASSSGWATQGSPWGDPAAQAQPPAPPASTPQAPANPFSQPPAAPSFAQPAQLPGIPASQNQMTAPEQPAGGDESRSSLARAADGALISPVKGRRRGAGTPAAFDWGSPDSSSSGNAGDPNQAGGADDSGDNKKIDDVLKGLFK